MSNSYICQKNLPLFPQALTFRVSLYVTELLLPLTGFEYLLLMRLAVCAVRPVLI